MALVFHLPLRLLKKHNMKENPGLKKISFRQLISGHPTKQKQKTEPDPHHKQKAGKLHEKNVHDPIIRRRGYGSYEGL
jgi:hypothetical protein